MKRLKYVLRAAAIAAISSCKVGDPDSNWTQARLESYADNLRCTVVDFTVLKISSMLDTSEDPLFDEAPLMTHMVSWHYSYKAEADLTFTYQSDTTWNFTMTSGTGTDGFENLSAAGTISFSTVRTGTRRWTVNVSGTTSEDTGYSSEFNTPEPVICFVSLDDSKKRYECLRSGMFRTLCRLDGKLFADIFRRYGSGTSTYYYERMDAHYYD